MGARQGWWARQGWCCMGCGGLTCCAVTASLGVAWDVGGKTCCAVTASHMGRAAGAGPPGQQQQRCPCSLHQPTGATAAPTFAAASRSSCSATLLSAGFAVSTACGRGAARGAGQGGKGRAGEEAGGLHLAERTPSWRAAVCVHHPAPACTRALPGRACSSLARRIHTQTCTRSCQVPC